MSFFIISQVSQLISISVSWLQSPGNKTLSQTAPCCFGDPVPRAWSIFPFSKHSVLLLVLLVITHCLPEIKHQEYANIYTHTTPVSGCSLVHEPWLSLSKPFLYRKKRKKKTPKPPKRLWGLSCTFPREHSHIPAVPALEGLWKMLIDFKKEMVRLFKNMLSINSNFLTLRGGHLHLPVSQSSLFPLVIWSPDWQDSNLVGSDKSRDTWDLALSLSTAFNTI